MNYVKLLLLKELKDAHYLSGSDLYDSLMCTIKEIPSDILHNFNKMFEIKMAKYYKMRKMLVENSLISEIETQNVDKRLKFYKITEKGEGILSFFTNFLA
jgi:DNA-binding PadR family transcriptional regulator